MQNEKPVKGLKLWYSYNKYKIATILSIIGAVIITSTIDMHITQFTSAANGSYVGIGFFTIMLVSIIQIVNAISIAKKRSPFSIILYTIFTLILFFALYVYANSYTLAKSLDGARMLSVIVIFIGLLFNVAANVLAFIFTDWKYVKVKE